jgi:prophage antirepressor-like protein
MTQERDEHGFTEINLDTIEERTASMQTGRVPLVDAPRQSPADAAIVTELELLRNEINCVTIGNAMQFHRWLMDELDRRVRAHGGTVKP